MRKRKKRSGRKREDIEKKSTLLIEEQVVLSQERTALSFMRTGLGFIGAGIIILNVFKENHVSNIFSWMLISIGIVLLIQYAIRLSEYRKKIEKLNRELENK